MRDVTIYPLDLVRFASLSQHCKIDSNITSYSRWNLYLKLLLSQSILENFYPFLSVSYFYSSLFYSSCLSIHLSLLNYIHRKATETGSGESTDNQTNKLTKAKENVLKTLVFLTVLFFLCWVWNITFFFLYSIGIRLPTTTTNYNFSVFMVNVNCCVNPFWYAFQYTEFQSQARKLFCKQSPTELVEGIRSKATERTVTWSLSCCNDV